MVRSSLLSLKVFSIRADLTRVKGWGQLSDSHLGQGCWEGVYNDAPISREESRFHVHKADPQVKSVGMKGKNDFSIQRM